MRIRGRNMEAPLVGGSAVCEVDGAADPSIVAFDDLMAKNAARVLIAGKKIGGEVLEVSKIVIEAFSLQRELLIQINQTQAEVICSAEFGLKTPRKYLGIREDRARHILYMYRDNQKHKPGKEGLDEFLKRLHELISKADAMAEGGPPDFFNQLKSAAVSLTALLWIAYTGEVCGMRMAIVYLEERWQMAEAYNKKVLVGYKYVSPDHVEWAEALKELYLHGLRGYVKSHYPEGTIWSATDKMASAKYRDRVYVVDYDKNFVGKNMLMHPWIIVSEGHRQRTLCYFNRSKSCSHSKSLSNIFGHHYSFDVICSTFGCIVLRDSLNDGHYELWDLASLTKMNLPEIKNHNYSLCVLSSRPVDPECLMLFLIGDSKGMSFAFFRVVDFQVCKRVMADSLARGENIQHSAVFHGKIYFVTSFYRLFRVDFSSSELQLTQMAEELPENLRDSDAGHFFYLVESGDSLLLVDKHLDILEDPIHLLGFKVHKWDMSHETWVEVKDLGDTAILISEGATCALSTLDPCCKAIRNTIYYFLPNSSLLYRFDLKVRDKIHDVDVDVASEDADPMAAVFNWLIFPTPNEDIDFIDFQGSTADGLM